MSRIDVPTLLCDRCKTTTQDTREMGRYHKITHPHMSGQDVWDLCPSCYSDFQSFLSTHGEGN